MSSKQPLLVHILFHPKSNAAKKLAMQIHHYLNDDFIVQGLHIPTSFCRLKDLSKPYVSLDIAAHSFVVPLADNEMALDDHWCHFVGDIWEECENSCGRHRFAPVQLDKHSWPLDNRLRGASFTQAFDNATEKERNDCLMRRNVINLCRFLEGLAETGETSPSPTTLFLSHDKPDLEKKRHDWVMRRIVIDLCRFLEGLATTGDTSPAPTKLFLSHAKADLEKEPFVTQKIIDYLKADQPVETWVDSAKIETGSQFSEAIQKGIKQTSLLAILTDNYSSREWCREEIMLAKEYQRPIVVIDALMTHEVRSFPFLDNVPRIRWDGNPQKSVDLLLKETLRHLHVKKVLNQSKHNEDIIFLRPPEPATILNVSEGKHVLYPDPPLGVGERKRLSKSSISFSTPLLRAGQTPFLKDKIIALSMSESTDIHRWGMDNVHLEQTMLELSRHLLIRGATLAYGGHLGPDSYTQRLFELVRTYNDQEGVEPFERIINHRGWPLPELSIKKRAAMKQVSKIIKIERPEDVDESLHSDLIQEIQNFFPGDKSQEHRFAWCRGMTEMRKFQANRKKSKVIARIILGGTFEKTRKVSEDGTVKDSWYSSRMPGVLEEILLSIQSEQPVFLIGAFGGAARFAIDLLLNERHSAASWEVQSKAPFAVETRELYKQRKQQWWYYDDEERIEGLPVDDDRSIVKFLADSWKPKRGSKWKTGINPLSPDKNEELFETIDCEKIITLILDGLSVIE